MHGGLHAECCSWDEANSWEAILQKFCGLEHFGTWRMTARCHSSGTFKGMRLPMKWRCVMPWHDAMSGATSREEG